MGYTYRSFRVPLAQFGLGVIAMVSCLAWLIGFGLRGEFVGEGAVILCSLLAYHPTSNQLSCIKAHGTYSHQCSYGFGAGPLHTSLSR